MYHFPNVLCATFVFALFVFIPGFVVGWFSDTLKFRERTVLGQCAVAVPLSLSLESVLVFIPWRFCSIRYVWAVHYAFGGVFAILVALTIARKYREGGLTAFLFDPRWRLAIAAALFWAAIASLSLCDLQFGSRQYYSTTAYDYSSRVPIASELTHTPKLPPPTPFLSTQPPALLRYHYFWLLLCGLTGQLGGHTYTERDAVIAGTVWSGLALLCVIALYLRFLWQGAGGIRRYGIAFALLAVTGLDLIPTLAIDITQYPSRHDVSQTIEWWNEQITAWGDAMLWVPHNIACLVAGLFAILLLQQSLSLTTRARCVTVALSGVALASAMGMAVYLALIFGLCLFAWAAYLLLARQYVSTVALVTSGVIALIVISPFLISLFRIGGGTPDITPDARLSGSADSAMTWGGLPVVPTIRAFSGTDWVQLRLNLHGIPARVTRLGLRLLFLPLNYFLELGFFFYIGFLQWQIYRHKQMKPAQTLCLLILGVSVVASTFLRSNVISNNDFGWRGFMPAQFVLLLWATDIWLARRTLSPSQQRWLAALLILGVMGTAYDLLILRFYSILKDTSLISSKVPGHNLGERGFAVSNAFAWVRANTPASALVQVNPDEFPSYWYGLYGERASVATGGECEAYSGRTADCAKNKALLRGVFAGTTTLEQVGQVCEAFPLDIIVAVDTDAAWRNKASWIWTESPSYSNKFARVFRCHSLLESKSLTAHQRHGQ